MTKTAEQYKLAVGSALISALALAGFLAIYMEANSFGREAAFFPHMAAILGMASAAISLAQSCWSVQRLKRHRGASLMPAREEWKDLLISFGGPPVYGAAICIFGYWIASIVGLAGLFVVLGERRVAIVAGLTAATLLVIYVVFELAFSIRMPGSLVFDVLARH